MVKNVTGSTVLVYHHSDDKYRSYAPNTSISLQTFKLKNTETSTSKGYARIGLPFKRGAVTSLDSLIITKSGVEVDCQFDKRSYWEDGSLRYTVAHIRDSQFSSSEERTYVAEKLLGTSFDNTGVKSLSDITSNTDFKIEITNNQRWNGSTNESDPVGSSLYADFNTFSSTTTRVTKIHSGKVCETWVVWGMFNDGVSTNHDHLKSNFIVTIWKNSDGTINDYEVCSIIAMDWWAVASKYRQDYDLTLKDNTTTLESYTAVQHPYHSWWATVDKTTTSDAKYAKSFWRTEAPTLYYKPDRAAFIDSGLVPPLDLTITANTINADTADSNIFIPCHNINHGAVVDNTGSYAGRGVITDIDAKAFISQDPTQLKYARTNAHAGLHIPYHYRSEYTRTRPSESADIANTIFSFKLTNPIDGVTEDFTSEGMPAAKHACVTSSTYPSGYVTKNGGNGVWTPSTAASHAVPYSFFMYLMEGEHYFYEATLSHATNVIHQANDGVYSTNPSLMYATHRSGIPTSIWTGVAPLGKAQTRGVGWCANVCAAAYAITSDDDIQTNCFRNWIQHSCEWCYQSSFYLPQSQIDAGIWYDYSTNESYLGVSPWMMNFLAMGINRLHYVVNHRGSKVAAEISQTWVKELWSGDFYKVEGYYMQKLPHINSWVSGTNEYLDPNDIGYYDVTCSFVASTGTFAITATNNKLDFLTLADNDTLRLWGKDHNGNAITIDPAFSEGTVYHLVSTVTDTSFKLSATQGGSAITGATDGSYRMFFKSIADAQVSSGAATVHWNDDDYAPIAYLALISINAFDNTIISDSLVTTVKARMANWSPTTHFAWAAEK